MLCPQAMLLRDGKVCEDCVGKLPWRAVTRKCYRDSTAQSAVLSGMLSAHLGLGTYRGKITRYIALNQFCRDKFIKGGFPAERFRIKPNFVVSPRRPDSRPRRGGIFVGRLSHEKGLSVLIDALGRLRPGLIRIVGKGPLEAQVSQVFQQDYLGYQEMPRVLDLLHDAQYMVAPSTCYETFGLAALEAFACGTPVIASRHGGLGELVRDGVTGLLVTPGDAADLAAKIAWAEAHPDAMRKMGEAARAEYETTYTPERNYQMLIDIYEDAIAANHGVPHAA
jgi:glycosyltransferase involved in cell wall biosynthesis